MARAAGRSHVVLFRGCKACRSLAGWKPAIEFDTADLDQAMALFDLQSCRFGVEHDFTHSAACALRARAVPRRLASLRQKPAPALCRSQ